MAILRNTLLSFAAMLGFCVGMPASAEVWTASFTGTAYGYDNHGPYAPQNPYFITDHASGSMIFDPSQISFNGFYYSGPGVELTFKVWNHVTVRGGIGDDPMTMPEGSFWAGSTPTRQSVSFVGGNGGCGLLCSGSLVLSGLSGAFGPDDLTPQTFHPGPVLLNGSSYAVFGDRDFGATIYLTSIRFTPNGSVGAIPEPSTYATMLIGLALLGYAVRQSKRRAAIKL